MDYFQVTAAIIRKEDKILICQRAKDDDAPLLWEFPGGKLEPGETLEACIVREIKEELELDIRVKKVFSEVDYSYLDRRVHFTFFEAEILGGEMKLNVHEDARWVARHALQQYEFLPADIDIVQMLQNEREQKNFYQT